MKKYKILAIFVCLSFLFFSGCVHKDYQSANIILPEQDLTPFVRDSKELNRAAMQSLKKEYLTRFFSPFDKKPQFTQETLRWGLNAAYANLGYGENLLPYTKKEIQALEYEANLEHYPSVKKPAIITRNSNLRVLPTNKPRFYNPKTAGEGFPFDYWQNSSIYLGTPVLITHYSRSKKWAYVESGFVSGWINVLDVGILNDNQVESLRKTRDFIVVKKDYTPLTNAHKEFLESARIGMLLPLVGSTKKEFETEIYVRNARGYTHTQRVVLKQKDFAKFPMVFSNANVAALGQDIMGEKYGWGGMFGNRDCSMFLRDVFGNFGIFLPRNSQAQMDVYLDLSGLSREQKLESIKKYGIPFATFLGMRGHIMLYIGAMDGEIYVLHDIWGLRTLQNETQEGREILGKILITPVEIGKNVKGIVQDRLLIDRIYGMRNLFGEDALNVRQ
ncbi:SH3 domain-containing C40 family peptidase [Helicobacter sp.]|uniref:SH3 domain-containing C40 family peptidase n=1 Tax=Helicobacter sp. TaxID=218 RepID=UPI0025BD0B38|nr:SH3 domain-containing C40 family peptidase [Helicobacter sp.]MCI5968811.1 SH3 domain-containing protein [Helicobacter sp.]MDY2584636.1 SH3 domain-containing protein [Helicobacter sp.]